MQKLTVTLVVLLGLVSVIVALSQPNPTSTVSQPANYTYTFSGQIGQNTTAQAYENGYVQSNNFDDLQGITWFAQSNYSYILGGPGLFTTDYGYDRCFFFNQNNLNAPTSYNVVFGAPNGTCYGDYGYYSVDYTANGVYALVNQDRIYYWNFSMINLAVSTAYPNPSYTFANVTSESGVNQYTAISGATQVATKKSSGEIFIADNDCNRILTFTAGSQIPNYAIGQSNTVNCGDDYCDYNGETTTTTCLNNPQWMAFDCYDGLWVWDESNFLYFPNNSKIATFAFNSTDDISDNLYDGYGLQIGPFGCNYLTALGQYQTNYIFYVTYGSIAGVTTPVNVQSLATFGSAYGQSTSNGNVDHTNTGSLDDLHGVAFNNNTAFFSDYEGERVVELNLTAIYLGLSSAYPSTGASQSNYVAPTQVAASASSSYIPRSSGASASTSPTTYYNTNTATASPIYSSEGISESNSPIVYYTGASSQMTSWVNLF